MTNPFRAAANTLETLKTQFLFLQEAELTLDLYSALDGVTFPPGFVNSAELVGTASIPISSYRLRAPSAPISISEDAPSKTHAMAGQIRNASDGLERFVIRPRTFAFTLTARDDEDGRSSAGFRLLSKRRRNLCDRYAATALAAGRAMRSVPLADLTWADPWTPHCGHDFGRAQAFWEKIVFDLAWQQAPGSALFAYRERPFQREEDRPYLTVGADYGVSAESLRKRLADSVPHVRDVYIQILNYYGDALPDFYISTILDIAANSALAAGMLADELWALADKHDAATHPNADTSHSPKKGTIDDGSASASGKRKGKRGPKGLSPAEKAAKLKLLADWRAARRQGTRTIDEFASNRGLNPFTTRAKLEAARGVEKRSRERAARM
jgi:hypothetical protein